MIWLTWLVDGDGMLLATFYLTNIYPPGSCQTPAIMDVENQSFLGFSRNGNFTTKSTIVLSVTRSAVGIKRIGNSFGVGKVRIE